MLEPCPHLNVFSHFYEFTICYYVVASIIYSMQPMEHISDGLCVKFLPLIVLNLWN